MLKLFSSSSITLRSIRHTKISLVHQRLRLVSSLPPPRKSRQLDLFAHFRRPPPTQSGSEATALASVLGTNPGVLEEKKTDVRVKDEGEFITSANTPVATSFQETPPPSSHSGRPHVEEDGTNIVQPIPAMKAIPPAVDVSSPSDSNGHAGTGAGRTKEMIVHGIVIPPKPRPPGEEECCMSGCVHCVYTIYAEELEQYTSAVDTARTALSKAGTDKLLWPDELRQGEGDDVKDVEIGKVEEGMDPSMSAFLALENKLKKR